MTDRAEMPRALALAEARARALAALEPDEKIRNPDTLAWAFLDDDERQNLKHPAKIGTLRTELERSLPGAYYSRNARTFHIDACLRRAVMDGFRQVVLIGAGFDTRAHRLVDPEHNVRFFELDAREIQLEKKAALAKLTEPRIVDIEYLPMDFGTDALPSTIQASGYDASEPSFFIWEGRSCTLTDDEVDAVLQFVGHHSVPDSRIVFDYIPRSMVDGSMSYYGGQELRAFMTQAGRPLSFGIEDRNLRRFLAQRDFELTALTTDQELQNRHLIDSAGMLHGRVSGYVRIAEATVTRRRGT